MSLGIGGDHQIPDNPKDVAFRRRKIAEANNVQERIYVDSLGNKLGVGSYVRAIFEHNYNSCNWGYVADFELVEYKNSRGKKYLVWESMTDKSDGDPSLSYHVNPKMKCPCDDGTFSFCMEIRKPTKMVRNCTGLEEYCTKEESDRNKLLDFTGFKKGLM